MKYKTLIYSGLIALFSVSCTSTKKLNYLSDIPISSDVQYFKYEIPDYKIQYRDILYIDIKTFTSSGSVESIITTSSTNLNVLQGESSTFLVGYSVDKSGCITLPVIGRVPVDGLKMDDIREIIQHKADSLINNAYVDVKLLSFKFTVLGEVRSPGTFINYSDYITVLEAVGKAGGIADYGRRDRILLLRPDQHGTKAFSINLNEKSLIESEAYFLMPNDVIIVEPQKQKVFNLNLPTISFGITTVTSIITTTLLLINYLK